MYICRIYRKKGKQKHAKIFQCDYGSEFELKVTKLLQQHDVNITTGAYSESCQTSKMECFTKTAKGFYQLIILAKSIILDLWQSSEYTSELGSRQNTSIPILHLLRLLIKGWKSKY